MTPAEIYLEMLKPNGRPERQLKQYEYMKLIANDPCNKYLRGNRKKGSTTIDRWGTTIMFPEDAPGAMPHVTPENKVCPDITRWREYVHAPDLAAHCQDGWEEVNAIADQAHADGKLSAVMMGNGMFEQLHFLMGFEDTLRNFYEHPKEMHELIDYIFEYRLLNARLVIENLHPDILHDLDDWGSKDSLFMKPDMWREFFKEPYRKFYKYVRSQGVIASHHADSYLAPIVEDMVEIGVQVWQGVLPENNIPKLLSQLQGRMVLQGGLPTVVDRADSTEEEIRQATRKMLYECAPYGGFIPSITYGGPGAVFSHVDPIVDDEIDKYNSIYHMPKYFGACPRRVFADKDNITQMSSDVLGSSANIAGSANDTASAICPQIATALLRGQKKKVLSLCQEGIDQSIPAKTLLDEGLIAGMAELGYNFSRGKAFVPEMLMAATCMTAATDLLKPYMVGDAQKKLGRLVLGTVRGDMHDIGKNLVKIMMEGNGIEVIDLGVDVTAEDFIDTAVKENADIICCSALLTTTMPEMKRVTELLEERNLRDRFTVMIGGAPITEDFRREIGADIYTDDANEAARQAVRILTNN